MKRNVIKMVALLSAVAMTVPSMVACGNSNSSSSSSSSSNSSKVTSYESYWTQDQKDTVDSIKKVSDDGYLYEMSYTGDYSLDALYKKKPTNSTELKEAFQDLYLKDSTFDVPKQIYGACSAFATKNADGSVILGRNYDWIIDDEVAMVVHNNPTDGYKSVGVADLGFTGIDNKEAFDSLQKKESALYAPLLTVDGMNEKGLCCTVLILEEDGTYQKTDKSGNLIESTVVRLLLDKASTVKEAEKLIRKYNAISPMYKDKSEDKLGGNDFHWLVTDKNGNKALFEFVDNKLVVNKTPVTVNTDIEKLGSMTTANINKKISISYPKKTTDYLLCTNFYVSEEYKGRNKNGEGYWRYKVLKDLLEKNSTPTNKEAMDYLKKVKYKDNDQDYIVDLKGQGKDPKKESNWEWLTVWSEVYDVDNACLNLCLRENYNKTYQFGITMAG